MFYLLTQPFPSTKRYKKSKCVVLMSGSRDPFKRFLINRSLTLPAAQPNEPQALFDDYPCTKKNARSNRNQRACMIRCMNLDEARGV